MDFVRPRSFRPFISDEEEERAATLRDGERVNFNVLLMDGAGITSENQKFAASSEGRQIISLAKANHEMSTGYLGKEAPPFTEKMAAEAIRLALLPRDLMNPDPVDQAREVSAHVAGIDALNAWRN